MAKYINLDYLIRFIKENGYIYASILENWPTVDAVEVVRCKDCRYYNAFQGCPVRISGCFMNGKLLPRLNDFCSYGERREENGES